MALRNRTHSNLIQVCVLNTKINGGFKWVALAEKRKCQSIFNCWLYFPLQHLACRPQFLPPHRSVCMGLPVSIQLKKPWILMERTGEKWCPLYHPSTLCSWERQPEALKPTMLGKGQNFKNLYCSNITWTAIRVKKKEYAVAELCFSSHGDKTVDNFIVNGDVFRICLAHKLFKMCSHY